ncbi:hypothetical protein [Sphingosinicella terrae]|nr:hypothetical protein [Sphingosinicella terrae]
MSGRTSLPAAIALVGDDGESPHWQLVGGARYMHLWQWTAAGPRLLTS